MGSAHKDFGGAPHDSSSAYKATKTLAYVNPEIKTMATTITKGDVTQ